MSFIQECAERLVNDHGFQGVPLPTFEQGGRAQLIRLLQHGLRPESRVLDIGCGVLRVAYWLIRFLDSDCYHGIEPAARRVELGRRYLFTEELLLQKRPRFDHNAAFDTSVFGTEFDYFNAGSIWTHCSKTHIEIMLDGFLRNTGPRGIFLTSYLPAAGDDEDYLGDGWVGTSHESTTPGVIRHSLAWIQHACQTRGLRLQCLPEEKDCDAQYWLRIDR